MSDKKHLINSKDLMEEIKECDKKLREEYEKNGAD